MSANVAQVGSTQQGIAYNMDQYIGIGVANSAVGMLYLNTTQPESLPFGKLVHIIAHANAVLGRVGWVYHLFLGLAI